MNGLFAGAAVVALTLVLWGLGKRPRKLLLSNTDASSVAALNRVQLTLVKPKSDAAEDDSGSVPKQVWKSPATSLERLTMQRQLRDAMAAGPEQRLEAVTLAGLWGHVSVMSLLRQGLHDSDGRVVSAAATALERYRGKSRAVKIQDVPPPRNVARMR
ncbi:MAG TPA: HEAT repeat domain-containing protein [Prochlorococcus sp.]|tara:strand:- start:3113 stop:3586 length:474 start_codon:yes stop_codon:yes gene_type:complete